ncbi:glycosyltransferase family 2 protein [Paludibacterium denitrificans]|uniref:glycosyltransferase family 2 protein n=1 Tax=Paludibacterium denitrificans TaxID=2675226 RepID=UPI001E4D27D5|nr:glycosyltransferase family 2 protein [Paludibacterium denitrificans]
MINILIPMAGAGSRFSKAGYSKPKPFIDVAGKPMIVRVLENLTCPNAHFILVARQAHLDAEIALVREIQSQFNATFISIDNLTEGTACTILHARKLINNDQPLLIANSDQIVDFDPEKFIMDCIERGADGSILTFNDFSKNPKWSFARIDQNGVVQEVREKYPISAIATVGIYFFTKGSDFVDAAIEMILHQDRVNNEYYTCPAYNYLIKNNKKIITFDILPEAMHGIGTPEDLDLYLAHQ